MIRAVFSLVSLALVVAGVWWRRNPCGERYETLTPTASRTIFGIASECLEQ